MKRPFVTLSIFLIIGILFGFYMKITYIIGLVVFVLVVLVVVIVKQSYNFIFLIGIISFGILSIYVSVNKSQLIRFEGKELLVRGIVQKEVSKGEYSTNWILKIEKIKCKEEYSLNEKMLLNVAGNNSITIGDYILVKGVVDLPNTNTNPKLFSYRQYLMSKGIYTTMRTKSNDIRILESGRMSFMQNVIVAVRTKFYSILECSLSGRSSDFAKAIIFSDDDMLDEEVKTEVRGIGMAHIIAVSGFHIWILCEIITRFLCVFIDNKRVRIIISLVLIWFYGALIGYPASVERTLIMVTCIKSGHIFYKRADSINSLGLAAFIILSINPMWLFGIGFQLSFSAALSLILFTKKIKIPKKLSALSAIIAVQIGIIPVLIYHFNQIPVFAILVNLILMPLVSVVIVFIFIILFISLISMKVGVMIGFVAEGLVLTFRFLSHIAYDYYGWNLVLTSPDLYEIAIYYCIVMMAFGYIRLKSFNNQIKWVVFIQSVIVVLYIGVFNLVNEEYLVEFLDIGQGDCIHLNVSNKNYLIDTGGIINGSFDNGEKVVAPYLLKEGVGKLDGLFITHFDQDHCAGAKAIMNRIKVDSLYISYLDFDNNLCKEVYNCAKISNADINIIKKGDVIDIDSNSKLKVVYPKDVKNCSSANDKSLVMQLDVYGTKILFTGDIEQESEDKMLSYVEDIDILKVAHHGSKTSSSIKFLKKCNAECGIISVGKNNYGHPSKEVLERFDELGARVLRTDKDGFVAVEVTKNGYNIESYNRQKRWLDYRMYFFRGFGLCMGYILIIIYMLSVYKKRMKFLESYKPKV